MVWVQTSLGLQGSDASQGGWPAGWHLNHCPGWVGGLAHFVTTLGSSCQIHEWGISAALRTATSLLSQASLANWPFFSGVQHCDRTALKWQMDPL